MKFRIWTLFLMAVFSSAAALAQEINPPEGKRMAVFAGGCFWCMVHPFDRLDGVADVISGYTGGQVENPTYKQVSAGDTGHRESVAVIYNPVKVKYQTLLDIFWRNVDPFDAEGQFCDKGFQYTSAIFVNSDEEKKLAQESKVAMEKRLGKPIVTTIELAAPFYRAEDYHQYYYREHSVTYKYYRYRCGRDARLDEDWGDEARGEAFGIIKE